MWLVFLLLRIFSRLYCDASAISMVCIDTVPPAICSFCAFVLVMTLSIIESRCAAHLDFSPLSRIDILLQS
ncbi:hypothetical protein RchiOBHm_Chr7g0197401 [Rosa chinensis]|uniref:Secreted peptide n=1 Tax=Rosa chinensis TaxID=74649 RepID=A0A2P6P6W6_ROSCH|nr:hypothetical protein RchiOBHm_Chr7g0197401 [Rosa chinensis]